jgi:alkane 1-monooxygenase
MFVLAYAVPLTLLPGLWLGGPWVFFTLAFVFVITPAIDGWLGRDERDRSPRSRWLYDVLLWMLVPLQLALLGWTLAEVTEPGRLIYERVGLVLSMGVVAGATGITVAHELMHRPRAFERAMAEVLMVSVSYPHFCIEHVFGHHRHVATPLDPASARKGESVYRFLPRTLLGGWRSYRAIEAERVAKHGRRGLADARLRYPIAMAVTWALVLGGFGLGGLLAFLGQSAVAVALLEVINYVEHYGLRRRRLDPSPGTEDTQRYERVRPEHSWNSAHRLTNAYLFHLPRHADHHFLASRPYHELRHHPEGPQLPAGYATMVILALAPPLWFRVMNPRVEALGNRADGPPTRGLSASSW